MLNKPKGFITADKDHLRPTVMELFPKGLAGKVHPVGRLDKDTVGLLLVTDDGKLANFLMLPQNKISKRYYFCAFGKLGQDAVEKLSKGIRITKDHIASPSILEISDHGKVGDYLDLYPERRRGQYIKNIDGDVTCGYVTVTEGKKHEVKKLIKAVGGTIFHLKRVSIGTLELDSGLKEGEFRELTKTETEKLFDLKTDLIY